MRTWIPGLLFLLVLATRFAEPVQDGDLFWHMAYGQQMIDHHTLVPDHTIYSWTPADSPMIYCTWLAELALLGVWNLCGLAGVFVLRYIIVLGICALWWNLAQHCGVRRGPLFWLAMLMALLASYVGSLPKPESFSLFLFNLLVWVLFRAKLAVARGASPLRWIWAMPPLFLLWVNTHGAFILAAPLLVAFLLGEIIHAKRGTPARLPLKPLLASITLSALATACTPYGFAYPKRLLEEHVLHSVVRPDVGWNAAYQTIFSVASWAIPFPALLLGMTLLFAAAFWHWWRKGRNAPDWSILLAFVFYIPLFIIYLRTTFYLPSVFIAGWLFFSQGDSAVSNTSQPSERKASWLLRLGYAAYLLFAVHTLHQTFFRPLYGSWCGFGIGGVNPVEEAEFLARQDASHARLVNLFNTGGYLLWRLWPHYLVMVDSRSFPYLGWFNDQFRFGTGSDFDAFLAKYPAPIAVIDMDRSVVWQSFLFSKRWEPLFYGRAAVIFQRAGSHSGMSLQPPSDDSLRDVRNGASALNLFVFARLIADYRVAWMMQEQLHRPLLRWQLDAGTVRAVDAYHGAHDALRAGQFDQANTMFREALNNQPANDTDKVILSLLEARRHTDPSASERATIEAGLLRLAAPAIP